MQEINVKYRTWFRGVPPRQTKLEVPGWAGEKTWDTGQPWHCKPFKDGSTYGLELIYPFETEVTVTTKDNKLVWTGDFTQEKGHHNWERPFSDFAQHHFGFTSSLDIQTDPGFATLLLPHPRFYTDRTGTVPVMTGGMIESDWWPRVFFIVFKSPLEGQTYVFRKGEGYGQIIIVPKEIKYNIKPMTDEEAKERAEMENIIGSERKNIATKTWKTLAGEEFDNKYKILSGINQTEGSIIDHLNEIKNKTKEGIEKKQENARKMFPRRLIKNENHIHRKNPDNS